MTNKILLAAITLTTTLLLYPGLVAFTPQSTTHTTLPNFPPSADAIFDAFLKIDGIEGETSDPDHHGEIKIESFSWGMSQTGVAHLGGGGGAGKVSFHDFSIVKALDKASPKLALACASGQHIKEVTLTLLRAGGDRQKYMEYKMTDVIITSVNQGGNANGDVDKPLENVSFNYGKIEWKYTQLTEEGGPPGGTTQAGWDLKKNQQI